VVAFIGFLVQQCDVRFIINNFTTNEFYGYYKNPRKVFSKVSE
jgi:hypothetical protein